SDRADPAADPPPARRLPRQRRGGDPRADRLPDERRSRGRPRVHALAARAAGAARAARRRDPARGRPPRRRARLLEDLVERLQHHRHRARALEPRRSPPRLHWGRHRRLCRTLRARRRRSRLGRDARRGRMLLLHAGGARRRDPAAHRRRFHRRDLDGASAAPGRAARARAGRLRSGPMREAMAREGYEALVICGRGDEFVRGRIQYVSDIFQWAGWGFVVLPAKGEASYVGDPLWGTARAEAAGWIVDLRLTLAPGEEIAAILSDHGLAATRVGLVGIGDAGSWQHVRALYEAAPAASFADATDLFDGVRAVKSAEEIAALRETSAILRRVFGALAAEIRPGVAERDVLAEAHRLCRQFGCLDGIALMGRPPFRFFGAGSE